MRRPRPRRRLNDTRASAWARARAALVAGVLVLGLTGPARAHVIPSPTFVEADGVSSLALAGPNERDEPMTGFALAVPDGITIVRAHAPAGWQIVELEASRAVWVGGPLAPEEEETFHVELRVSMLPGQVTLETEQRYPDGELVRWPVSLLVIPASQEQNLGLALVIGIVGLLALATLALLQWYRRSGALQER